MAREVPVSIGETLADARQRAGLSVAQVSERTRIRPPIIDGIEAGDFAPCGGDFYARGNIRGIAQAVGIDPQPLIEEYDRVHRAGGPAAATSLDELLSRAAPVPPRRHRRWVAAGVAGLAVLGVAGYLFLPQSRPPTEGAAAMADSAAPSAHRPAPAPAPRPTPTLLPVAAGQPAHPRARTMGMRRARAFGPPRTHRGDDPRGARLAIDGRRGTAWHTDWYATPHFGNLQIGTGLLVDMGRRVTITAVRVTLGAGRGVNFQIRVGDRRRLGLLRPVARHGGRGGVIRLRLHRPRTGRYVLVWFNRLPRGPAGTFRAAIYGIGVKGWH
jgi:transcriptional regulator with XRE-family HTH domain